MARTVASATSRTAATATYRITAATMAGGGHGHGHGHNHCHSQLHGRNNTTNAQRLLRRSCLGRAAAGEPPSCVSRYCCANEKGQGRARMWRKRGIITEEHKNELTFHIRRR